MKCEIKWLWIEYGGGILWRESSLVRTIK